MKILIKSSFFSLLIVFLLTTILQAQPGMGWRHAQMKEKLNLTETQETQLEKLRNDHQKSMIDLRAKLQKAKVEAREVMSKDDFKRSDYLAAQEKISKIQNEIHSTAANHRMDVVDILNKDQRKIFLDSNRKFDGKKRNFMNRSRTDGESRNFGCSPRQRCLW